MNILKRGMACFLCCVMVLTLLSTQAARQVTAASGTELKTIRVVVDAEASSITGYYADESFWVSKNDVLLLTGVCPEDYTKEFSGEVYYNLAAASHIAGFGYYSYDTVLDAVYIWSKDRYFKETYDVAKVMARKEVTRNLDFYNEDTCDKTITVAQYMTLLDQMVAYADKDRLEEWQGMYSQFRDNTNEMKKADGMYLLLYAGEFLGGDYMEIGEYDSYSTYDEIMQKADDGMKKYDPGSMFTDKEQNVVFNDGTQWGREVAAYFYCIGRWADATGEMVAGYDEANTAIHADWPLTIKDAVDMVVRNIEASGNLRRELGISEEELHYEDYNEDTCSALPENGILQTLLNESLENSTDDNSGDYETGFILSATNSEPINYVNDMDADDIRHIAEWGYKKVRLNAGFVHFFKDPVNMTQVCPEAMEKLDELVAAGIRYNVQIDICTDELPGWWQKMGSDYKYYGSVDIISNTEHRDQAKSFIRMLTKRYQSVPKDALCFTLFVEYGNWNRTNGSDFSDTVSEYTEEEISNALMELVSAVKSLDSNREIFLETHSGNYNEAETLATTKAREQNVYFTANYASGFVYYAFEETDDRVRTHILQEWPQTIWAGQNWIVGTGSNRQDEAVPMVLKGDLKAGSKVELYLQQVTEGTFVIQADGKEIKRETLDPANDENAKPTEFGYEYEVNEKEKNYVKDYGTTAKCITFDLEEDVSDVQISFEVPEENGWASILWSGLCITYPQEYAKDQWIYITPFDADTHPDFFGNKAGYELVNSSKLYIGNISVENVMDEEGNWNVKSVPYTISSDLTYKTDEIAALYDKADIEKAFTNLRKQAGDKKAVIRFETAFGGGLGTGYHPYYDDLLSTYQKNNLGWLSNDFGFALIQKRKIETVQLGGDSYVPYYEYEQFNPVLMEILQKYQNAEDDQEGTTGHVWGKGTVTKEASCTTNGEMNYTCTLCSKKKTVTMPKEKVHKETEVRNQKAATESQEGYTGDTYCKECGEVIEKGKVIPKVPSKSSETEASTEDKNTSEEKEPSEGDKKSTEEETSETKTKKQITELKLTGISKTIAAGKKLILVPAFTPADASNKGLVWTTSNTKYATVSSKGVVTTKSKGAGKTVTIKAATKDGSNVTASYKIKIVKHAVKSIKLSAKNKTVKAGKKLTVKATVKTTGKTANKIVQWSSSNTKYATVSKKGVVTAKKAGKGKTVKITAMATDGSGKKATIKIKIKK